MDIQLKIGGRNLVMPTTCFCISSITPYIVIDKTFTAGGKTNYVSIHKTEESTSQSPNPTFAPIKLKAADLCNSKLDQPIQFKLYNKVEDAPSTLLGVVSKSITELVENKLVDFIDPVSGRVAGQMAIEELKVTEKPTMLMYIKSGWGISL